MHSVGDAAQWQTRALAKSKLRSGQPGKLMLRFDTHREAWAYPILSRVLAFHRVMRKYEGAEPVAILDPDMVMLRSLETTAEPGWGQATFHPAMEAQRSKAAQLAHLTPDAEHMPLVDLPWVLSADDARRLGPVWLDFTERMVQDPSIRSLFGWMLDMWALCAAAQSLGIAWDTNTRLTCVPGLDEAIGQAWVLHYHLAPVHGFDKRWWQPGEPMEPAPEDEPYEALRAALGS